MSEPISNPNISPTGPVSPYGRDQPQLGAQEGAQEPKPFSMGPEKQGETTPQASAKPSPMEVAGDAARQHPQIPPQELSEHVAKLQNTLSEATSRLQTSETQQKLGPEHTQALQKLTQKMSPDMHSIAKYSEGTFTAPAQEKGESPLASVLNWINGSQATLKGALNYLQTTQNPDPASYLRLQYAIQRATQRGELFASIIGSSVSGIKTIMSTQLG